MGNNSFFVKGDFKRKARKERNESGEKCHLHCHCEAARSDDEAIQPF